MEDRLKFRAWLKNYKKMADVFQITFNESAQFIKFYTIWLNSPRLNEWGQTENINDCISYADLKDVELIQCTGLKDKNGELIYESDIAKDDDGYENYKVVWDNESASYKLKQGLWLHEFDNNIEIIGNIFENPELLEVDND